MKETIDKTLWWVTCGYPAFDAGGDGFPEPGQIIQYYRQHKIKKDGKYWTQKDLARALNLTAQAACLIEKKGIGLESVTRRRLLTKMLDVPPVLLGLAEVPQGKETSGRTFWWIAYGYPAFDTGDDGFPEPGRLIRYYRQHKIKSDGKRWMQKDLAHVLDLTEQAVCLMEKKGIGLESITRRRLLAEMLGIPPMLLGLAEMPERETDHPVVSIVNKSGAIDLAFYEMQLHGCYNAHHRRASYEHLSNIQEAIASLYQVLPFSDEKGTRQLLSRYHILIASIMRDQCLFSEAVEHLNRAIYLTKQIGDDEFLADAFYRQGWVYLEQREGQKAVQNFLSAEKLLKKIPSYMVGGILIGLGRSLAMQAQDTQGCLMALHTLDKAANILRVYPLPDGNWHYLEIELDRYHIDKSAAFLDIRFPREALQELSYLRSSANNQRRTALISVLEAQAYFSLGKYAEACSMAEEALDIIKPIHSVVNYKRIKTLHSQLKLTNFGDNPEVAHIGIMLSRIHSCWHVTNGERKHV